MNKLSDDEGWIRWTDSHPRPADDVLVEVITENGRRDTNKAGAFMWYGITDALRIVAYRFVKEENEMPTNHEIFETLPAHETWIEWQQCYIKPNDHQLVKVYLKDGKISSGLKSSLKLFFGKDKKEKKEFYGPKSGCVFMESQPSNGLPSDV